MDDQPDAEIDAMATVSKALAPLDDEQRGRVIRWVADRYGVTVAKKASAHVDLQEEEDDDEDDDPSTGSNGQGPANGQGSASGTTMAGSNGWEHFAELYDAADPATDAQRVLVAAYWVQYVEGTQPFFSIPLNKLLKDLGHGVAAVAHATSALTDQKPALLLQLTKSGKSRQARKSFKVTDAGRKAVEQMIAANGV